MRRKWIKIHCEKWLQGSIRQESIEVRSIFADLLAVAGDSSFGEDGRIQIAPNVGFTDEGLSALLNIPLEVWLSAKERLSNHPDPSETRIEILPLASGFAIQIINWKFYQSDYSRVRDYQKEYFQRKKARASLSSSLDHPSSLSEEKKTEKQKEKKRKKLEVLSSASNTASNDKDESSSFLRKLSETFSPSKPSDPRGKPERII
jgi:hypothetical protein